MLRSLRVSLQCCMSKQHWKPGLVSLDPSVKIIDLLSRSSSTAPYCATYLYESGSVGYGCAVATGYTVSILLSTTTSDGGRLTTASPASSTAVASSTSATLSTSSAVASSGSKSGLGGGPIAGIVIGSIAVIALLALLAFLLFRMRRKHREEVQALKQQQNLQNRISYASQPYPGTTDGYHFQNKEGFVPSSPPLSEVPGPASPYGPNFTRAPRDSGPPVYMGPTIPEMGTEVDHSRARPGA
jgi:hypothetical protein